MYVCHLTFPDLTQRLNQDKETPHQEVNTAPTRGDLALTFSHGKVVATMEYSASWHPPPGIMFYDRGNCSVLVRIDEVRVA
jgi:hypothetical protein